MRRFTCKAPTTAKPIERSASVNGDAAGTVGAVEPGPATVPAISMLLATSESFAMPTVANETVPLKADGAVMVKPKTCFAMGKLPVPHVGFDQTTFVPPLDTVGVKAVMVGSSAPKSADVGAPALVTPVSPVMVMVVGLTKRLQLSNGSKVRVYVQVGGPAEASVHWTACDCHAHASRMTGSKIIRLKILEPDEPSLSIVFSIEASATADQYTGTQWPKSTGKSNIEGHHCSAMTVLPDARLSLEHRRKLSSI
jgi:hypothetical protein